MTNNNEASENAGKENVAVKKNIGHRFIKTNSKTPIRILLEKIHSGENPFLLMVEDAYKLIEKHEKHCTYQFYEKNKAFLPIAEKKMAELSSHYAADFSVSNFIQEYGKPSSELIKRMEEEQKPILCIDEPIANLASMLIFARTQSMLLSKFRKDLMDGEEQLFKADLHFEELCSGLKIGRRTRAIISRKKINGLG